MIQAEKDKIIALFDDEQRWCQNVDAADQYGSAVGYDDGQAVKWDLVGGLCHLFGWGRASQLFGTVSRHVCGRRHPSWRVQNETISAMSLLLDFNDRVETTHELMISSLRDLPIWHGRHSKFGIVSSQSIQ